MNDQNAWLKLLDVVAEEQCVYPRNLTVNESVRMDGNWLVTEVSSPPKHKTLILVRVTDLKVRRYKAVIGDWVEVNA